MPRAIVSYHYSTGESVMCEVESDQGYPDELDQIATRARRLYAEVMADERDRADEDAEPNA